MLLGITALLAPIVLAAAVSRVWHGYAFAPSEVDLRLANARRVYGAFAVWLQPSSGALVCDQFSPTDWRVGDNLFLHELRDRDSLERVAARVNFGTFVNWFTNDWACDTQGIAQALHAAGLQVSPSLPPPLTARSAHTDGFVVDFISDAGDDLRLVYLHTTWSMPNDLVSGWTESTMRPTATGWKVVRTVTAKPMRLSQEWMKFPNLVLILAVALGLPLAGASVLLFASRIGQLQKRRRRGLCLHCAYDRKGIEGVCPECGLT
jgi:hypothetical protein